MKIIELNSVNEKVYYEKLDNGLDVYVLRKKDFETTSATFMTKFGGLDTEFVPIDKKEIVKMPAGIAHFLEHKLFEQEKGESVSDFFKKSGTSFNAGTNENRTQYYFVGLQNFKENLCFLLDYVQSPYFTDTNVEKEKGIIKEEILMCKDNPSRKLIETTFHNLFNEYPYYNTVIGEIEDINKITKEDLYTCYNTFYHPSNMGLIVVSNLPEEEVINIVKENQSKKQYKNNFKIIRKEYNELDNVRKEYEIIYDKVTETRVMYGLKFKKDYFSKSKTKTLISFYILFDILIGELSKFTLDLKEQKKILGNIGFSIEFDYEYLIFKFLARPNDEKEYILLLEEQLKNKEIKEEDFLMIKKSILSSELFDFNTVEGTMTNLCNSYIFYDDISDNAWKEEKSLTFDEFKNIISKFNMGNKSIVIMKPNEEE